MRCLRQKADPNGRLRELDQQGSTNSGDATCVLTHAAPKTIATAAKAARNDMRACVKTRMQTSVCATSTRVGALQPAANSCPKARVLTQQRGTAVAAAAQATR